MIGENFKFVDRKSLVLEKLVSEYRAIVDENRDLYDTKIRYNEASQQEFDRYYNNQTRLKYIAYRIWNEAFIHYGRTNEAANEYCKSHGILYMETH